MIDIYFLIQNKIFAFNFSTAAILTVVMPTPLLSDQNILL
jgi:hypothetical protein